MQVRLALNLVRLYAVLSEPFIPDAAASLMATMQTDDYSWPSDISTSLAALPAGHSFSVPEVTFRKIADDEITNWQTRFSGIRAQ